MKHVMKHYSPKEIIILANVPDTTWIDLGLDPSHDNSRKDGRDPEKNDVLPPGLETAQGTSSFQ